MMTATDAPIEISHGEPFICPFCNQKVLETVQDDENHFHPCPHILYVAHDMGLDYRSARFDVAASIVGVEFDDIDLPALGVDGLTRQVKIDGCVKFASYIPAPSSFGTYVGFAPIDS